MSDSYFIGTVPRVHGLLSVQTRASRRSQSLAAQEVQRKRDDEQNATGEPKREIGMMVSLDHSIFFHRPRDFRADEWMFCEMESPWAGDGRGVVHQRIFTRDGRLIATCIQEVSPFQGEN